MIREDKVLASVIASILKLPERDVLGKLHAQNILNLSQFVACYNYYLLAYARATMHGRQQ